MTSPVTPGSSERPAPDLALGLLGTRGGLRRNVNLAFGVALFILLLTGGVSVWSNLRSIEAARQRRDIFTRRIELQTLLSLLQDAETGQRGYLLTGSPTFLAPHTWARD